MQFRFLTGVFAFAMVLTAGAPSRSQKQVYFEPNVGQMPKEVRFLVRGGHNVFLTNDGFGFDAVAKAVNFVGVNKHAIVEAVENIVGFQIITFPRTNPNGKRLCHTSLDFGTKICIQELTFCTIPQTATLNMIT